MGTKQLNLRNGSGSINVSTSDSAKMTVRANKVHVGPSCVLAIEKTGSTLVVEAKNKNSGRCEVHFNISLPREVSIDLKSGSGSVQVQGTKGPISYRTGSGNVDLDGEINRLEGRSGSGSINVKGLTGGADLQAGSGNISIVYPKKPENGELHLKMGSGNTIVFLPAHTKVKTSFKAGSGQLLNELGDTHDAKFTISVKTGSGNLAIKKSL